MNDGLDAVFQIPVTWVDLDETPIEFANNFLIQHQEGEFILTIGQISPPPLIGTPEERKEQASQISFVPIRVLARYGLTRRRMAELVKVLEDNLEKHDQKQGDAPEQAD